MSQEQADRAIEQLYGDASVRDELTDDEALVLLKWGEDQIRALAAQNLDDAQFEEALQHLLKLLTRVNRFTSRRADLLPEERQESLDKIAASAQAVAGFVPSAQAVTPPSFAGYLQQQETLDNIANIRALTALVAPVAPGTPPNEGEPASPSVSNAPPLSTDQPALPAPPTTGDHNGETQP
ncbi:MAG: hypothetical protein HZC41_04165 [Chloroflexi bacterium]|nr:hypothetical protein [Chloroflexota bacterium]